MIRHILHWFFQSTAVFLIGLPVTLLGLPLVAVGIFFRRSFPQTAQHHTDPRYYHLGDWMLVRLPTWLLWWDNPCDGLRGDKRGWWDNYCRENYSFSLGSRHWYSMWQWAAIRNPANYWSRVVTGCDVRTVELLAGQQLVDEDNPGWHFLRATDAKGKSFYYLGFVFPWWFDRTHAIYGRFGWKLKLAHDGMKPDAPEQDRIRASVYRVSFWKAID